MKKKNENNVKNKKSVNIKKSYLRHPPKFEELFDLHEHSFECNDNNTGQYTLEYKTFQSNEWKL